MCDLLLCSSTEAAVPRGKMQDAVPPLPTKGCDMTSQKAHGRRQGNSCIVPVALVRTRQDLNSRAILSNKAQEIR